MKSIGLLVFCVLSLLVFGSSIYFRFRKPTPRKERGAWLRTSWSTILWSIIWIWLLVVIGPWVLPLLWEIPRASLQAKLSPAQRPQISAQRIKPARMTENEAWYRHFTQTPRPFGWDELPTEVSIDVPLDKNEHYGINATFLAGSALYIDCPEHRPSDKFDLFVRGDQEHWICLGESNRIQLHNSGRAAGEFFLKGVRKSNDCRAYAYRVALRTVPLKNHIRIAITKQCETGALYDVMPVQIGGKLDSPPWKLYIRFADEYGNSLTDHETRQNPGSLFLGNAKDNDFSVAYSDKLLHPRNACTSAIVPESASDLMLRIKTPNIDGRRVVRVEIILDIDYSDW